MLNDQLSKVTIQICMKLCEGIQAGFQALQQSDKHST